MNDWLIMKRGLYFRPEGKGYTGIRDEAGRYPHEDALGYNDCIAIREADAPEFTPMAFNDLVIKHLTKQRDEARAALAATPAVGGERLADKLDAHSIRYANDYGYGIASDLKEAAIALRTPPASPLREREIPDGATHMRRPEYLTAWLFDGVATMPLWLIERYHSLPIPEHRKGCYALAVDGEFWRWMDVDRFNELYVSASPPEQPAAVPVTGREAKSMLTKIAAECHRAKWQFDLSDDYKPKPYAARGMILNAFNELHRIGDIAMKFRDALSAPDKDQDSSALMPPGTET